MDLILLLLIGCGAMVLAAGVLEALFPGGPPDWVERLFR